MEYLIEVENLNKTYPGFSLKNVNFKVPGGCIMGLVERTIRMEYMR